MLASVPPAGGTREAWLAAMVAALRPVFTARGLALPQALRVSCGWPARRALSARGRVVGECWTPRASADATVEIFVSPYLCDSLRVADVLVHELCHAAVGNAAGHGPAFAAAARAMGLGGRMTATVRTAECDAYLVPMVQALGLYPHAALGAGYDHPADAPKKQGTRMVRVRCRCCGYTLRTTRMWLGVAVPTCPACGPKQGMEVG